ncbi:thiolase family protein [Paucibacter sp. R3-3]|uniref:Thiolase family protein n=1 Tax=Roseateles agri TaxID=3098619 RepID=A0ABU5DP14_9BURK|nr:thiolase family protein [Paucibacter sp. R3-3]MDY0748060.1 thiolase family protein [Paucibacter sp. R3-3]
MSFVTGVGLTSFGRHENRSSLDLMTEAATAALADSGLQRRDVDGLVCGYATTMPHIMLSTLFAEHLGVQPRYAHAVQVGGATGFAMVMLAHLVVQGGAADHVLVVAGENRLTGQTRDATMQTLAQAGHARYEVPLGPTVPAYYALVASRYMHEFGLTEGDLAQLAVQMRRNAIDNPGAHLRDAITVDDVLRSTPIATPLKLMDCCPISDGAAAFIVSREAVSPHSLRIIGASQAHTHQHVTAAPTLTQFGAAPAMQRAMAQAGVAHVDVGYAALYDSFTITLAILLEELGLAERGQSGRAAAAGYFAPNGTLPLNTHGGLLSYGHCGVAGALAHLAETHLQMTRRAGPRQIPSEPAIAMLHGDGGIMSSHISMIMERPQ